MITLLKTAPRLHINKARIVTDFLHIRRNVFHSQFQSGNLTDRMLGMKFSIQSMQLPCLSVLSVAVDPDDLRPVFRIDTPLHPVRDDLIDIRLRQNIAIDIVFSNQKTSVLQKSAVLRSFPLERVPENAIHSQSLQIAGDLPHIARGLFRLLRTGIQTIHVVVIPEPEIRRANQLFQLRRMLFLLLQRHHLTPGFAPRSVLSRAIGKPLGKEPADRAGISPFALFALPDNPTVKQSVLRRIAQHGIRSAFHPRQDTERSALKSEQAHGSSHSIIKRHCLRKRKRKFLHRKRHSGSKRKDPDIARFHLPSGRPCDLLRHGAFGVQTQFYSAALRQTQRCMHHKAGTLHIKCQTLLMKCSIEYGTGGGALFQHRPIPFQTHGKRLFRIQPDTQCFIFQTEHEKSPVI